MLKLPFDGEGSALGGANLKVHIMAGGRPIITHKVMGYSLSAGKLITTVYIAQGDYEKKLRCLSFSILPSHSFFSLTLLKVRLFL